LTQSTSEFAILEKILSNEVALFLSMSDEEVGNHIPNSRIKERVDQIGEYEVHIYTRDHNPPHFHVTKKDGSLNAKFRIDNGALMSQYGDLRSGVLKRINIWYNDIKTQTVLKTIWDKRN
jgi:hypothetical protein